MPNLIVVSSGHRLVKLMEQLNDDLSRLSGDLRPPIDNSLFKPFRSSRICIVQDQLAARWL